MPFTASFASCVVSVVDCVAVTVLPWMRSFIVQIPDDEVPSWHAGRFLQLGFMAGSQFDPIIVHAGSLMRPQEAQVPTPAPTGAWHSWRAPGNGGDEDAVSEPGQCML